MSEPQYEVHDLSTSVRTPPNELPPKAGIGRDVMTQRLSVKLTRVCHWTVGVRTGSRLSKSSTPRFRSEPPLNTWVLKPTEPARDRRRMRSEMLFW